MFVLLGYSGESRLKDAREGADTVVWLATTADDQVKGGLMYGNHHEVKAWVSG